MKAYSPQSQELSHLAPHSTLHIAESCIAQNVDRIREKVGRDTRLMAIVKASAYGTDMVAMTRVLKNLGVDIFGVAHVGEAITLRKAGIANDIFVVYAPSYHLAHIVDWNLQLAICDQQSLFKLEHLASEAQKTISVHLHVNTGMNRFGCSPEQAVEFARFIHESDSLVLEGVLSHFHSSDLPESDSQSQEQVQILDKTIQALEAEGITIPWKHMANSSAVCRFNLPQYNMVRVGISLYGAYLSDTCANALPLQLALKWTTHLVDIKHCKRGETVSYEASYTVKEEREVIGALGVGYHDGLHRNYGNTSYCLVNGHKAPYVGNICMDFSLVNLTGIPNIKVGDLVTIFGDDPCGQSLHPHELTATAKTSAHELLACIGPRVERNFY